MSEAIAVVGSNALAVETEEVKDLGQQASKIELMAKALEVKDAATSAGAAEFRKNASKLKKKIEGYWEPLRVDAKKAYDNVLAKKKDMLTPVESADKIVAQKINDYAYAQEQKRRAEEAAQRRALEAAASQKLAEAAQAETDGDALGAEMAMAEAEVYDNLSTQTQVAPGRNENGMSQRLGWEIVSLSPGLVPINICGQEVHITNKAVVEQLVRKAIEQANGNISIPGVVFKETMKVSVR